MTYCIYCLLNQISNNLNKFQFLFHQNVLLAMLALKKPDINYCGSIYTPIPNFFYLHYNNSYKMNYISRSTVCIYGLYIVCKFFLFTITLYSPIYSLPISNNSLIEVISPNAGQQLKLCLFKLYIFHND